MAHNKNLIETDSERDIAGSEDEELIDVLAGCVRDLEAGRMNEAAILSQNRRIAHRLRPCLAALQFIDEVVRSMRRIRAQNDKFEIVTEEAFQSSRTR